MKIHDHVPILDAILDNWKSFLGKDFLAYKNHCYRVLNFSLALGSGSNESIEKISAAVAFHDLGIWTNNTYDYLEPSRRLVRAYLDNTNRSGWSEEIETMIEQHHKLTGYKSNPGWLVERFRKADWIDVLKGHLKFGLPAVFVSEVMSAFPNAGFHKLLFVLTWQRFRSHPLDPLPMMEF